jgi:hypothetical protein
MQFSDKNENLPARRKLLGGLASVAGVSAAGLLGMNATKAAANAPAASNEAIPEELFAQARLRSYKTRRSSSWDRTGANSDAVRVEPGSSATLLDVTGAGVITHIWFTISSADAHHLKNLVLRAWWDGDKRPRSKFPSATSSGWGWASTSPTSRRCWRWRP